MSNPVNWHWGTLTLPEGIFFVLVLGSLVANAIPNLFTALGDLEWVRINNLNGQRERLGSTSVRNQWAVVAQHVAALVVVGYFIASPSPARYGHWVVWTGFAFVVLSVSFSARRWKAATQAVLQREQRRSWWQRFIEQSPPHANGGA